MGQLFDVGQEATGFIAIGQFATGFFAFGQVATGVVAIGQVARGFFVIGQAGFGLLSVGMASGGLIASVGMLGVGGRGWGGILPMVPRLREPVELPEVVPFEAIARGARSEGWVKASLGADIREPTRLYLDGAPADVRIDARLRLALVPLVGRDLLALIRREPSGLTCQRLMELPVERIKNPRWWLAWSAQLALLGVATVAFWYLAARPVIDALEKILS